VVVSSKFRSVTTGTTTTRRCEVTVQQGSTVKRAHRVAQQVREEVALALARDLADPRLELAVVTRVEMPDDLSVAKIMVRLATGADDAAGRKRVLAAFGAANGILRKRLAKNLGLRRTPELRFIYDEGQDASASVDRLLHEIAREKAGR
jgi:ribosome-binding factor A